MFLWHDGTSRNCIIYVCTSFGYCLRKLFYSISMKSHLRTCVFLTEMSGCCLQIPLASNAEVYRDTCGRPCGWWCSCGGVGHQQEEVCSLCVRHPVPSVECGGGRRVALDQGAVYNVVLFLSNILIKHAWGCAGSPLIASDGGFATYVAKPPKNT